ncbi:hypothetical protein RUW21_002250 [Enterobacter roggenkampii]|nr:hypothetical protein [Enterobacter roggenkampii]
MQGEVDEQQPNEIESEFGYYPVAVNIETEKFSLITLPNLNEKIEQVNNDKNVVKGWFYPGNLKLNNFNGGIATMPFCYRVFGMPKTHKIKLKNSSSQDTLNFVVWCLSFFEGIRLTTSEAGFLDATTIAPRKLTDFILVNCSEQDVIELALNYIDNRKTNTQSLRRIAAVVHALFLSQNPHYLSFEKFQYLYMALDGCFALTWDERDTSIKNKKPNHHERLRWMCEKHGLSKPSWATDEKNISIIRNDNFHEAIFYGEPLGFASVNDTEYGSDILLQMQALVCRLIASLLSVNDTNYLSSRIDSREYHSLKLKKL